MLDDRLNIYSENQKHCYRYLNGIRELNKGKTVYKGSFPWCYKETLFPVYQGTSIKTREISEGVYDIQFWFNHGCSHVTWHDGLQGRVMW